MSLSVFGKIEELEKEVDAIKKRLLRGAAHGREDTIHADEADVHVCGDTVQHAKETQED